VDVNYITKIKQSKDTKKYCDVGSSNTVFSVRLHQVMMIRKHRDTYDASRTDLITSANGVMLDHRASLSGVELDDTLT